MTSVYVFTTDWHLGAGTAFADNRLQDQEGTLTRLADIAKDLGADAVLFGGDAFHKPSPSNEARHVLRRFCDRLAADGIPMIAVHGNAGHDLEGSDRPTALELEASEWVRVSRQPELILAAGDLAVATLPSVQLGRLVAARDGGDRAELLADATDLLLRTAEDLYRDVPAGWPSVLLAHWALDWPGMPPQIHDHEPVLPIAALEQIGFDLILAGHIHIPQQVGRCISGGPPAHVSFGEQGLPHGCWVLTVDGPGQVEAEFVSLDDRRFLTFDVDLTLGSEGTGAQPREPNLDSSVGSSFTTGPSRLDETDLIAAEIAAFGPLDDAVVRIRYRATEEQHRRVDQVTLKRLALDSGAHRVYQITPDIVRASRARADGVDESLAPLEALTAWVMANDLADRAVDLADLTAGYLVAA